MRSITSTGTQLAIGLALCGAVLVGTLLSDDSEQTTPSTHALPVVSPSVSFNTSPTRVSSPVVVMPSSPLASSGRSTGDVAVSSYASARRSTNILVSTPSSHTSSPMGGGGGGGAMGASSSSSVTSSPSSSSSGGYAGGGYTSSVPMVLFAPGAKTVVVAPPTTIPSGFMGTGGSTTLPLYEGDEPGIIPGATNEETENPIVTSYGLPIGDTLWPLLLLALVYVGIKLLFNKRKMNKQTLHSMLSTLSHILFRRQRIFACSLLVCAMLAFFSTRAWAAEGNWSDYTEAVEPTDNLYEVHSAEQLAWVAQQVNSGETFAGKTVSMRADVDLSAHYWQPIGQNTQYTFAGTFDGNAHVISGMTIVETYTEYHPVNNGQNTPGYGLFGSLNGGSNYATQTVVVRNVVLESPSITLHVAGENKYTRVGLLAGFAGVKTTISNCNILDGQILIDGVPEQDGGTRFYVGGAIGSSAHGFAGAYTETNHYALLLNKIAVQANITIRPETGYVQGYQHTQNNVGGIIGRLRYGYQAFDYVLYTGTIDARQFTVSPSFGAWCNAPNGSNDRDLTKENYTGDVDGDWFSMPNVYFTTYQIKHDETTTAVTAGNLISGTTTTGTKSLRTLSSNYTGSTQDMHAFQGVNAGTYTTITNSLTENFNAGLSELPYTWKADGARLKLHRTDDIQLQVNGPALDVSFVDVAPAGAVVTFHWTKNGVTHAETGARVNMPPTILAPITWEVYASYERGGKTYHTNTCSYTQMGTVVEAPTISLDGATSDNTLSLTATLDRKEQTLDNVVYHWQKDSEAETVESATKAVEALTQSPAEWHVYATYTHNGIPYQTEPATYTQLPPVVTLAHTTNNNVLRVTPSMNTYGDAISNIRYYRVTYTENGDELRADTAKTEYVADDATGYDFSFEDQSWYILATYMANSQQCTSPIAEYVHPAAAFPVLTVTKNSSTLTADLTPDDVVTGNHASSLTYTWTKDGQTLGENTRTQTVSSSFADQVWTAQVSMTVNGTNYETELITYVVPSNLGDVQAIITDNQDNTLTAGLNKPLANVNITYTWKDSKGATNTETTYTNNNSADWVMLTARIVNSSEPKQYIERTAYHQFGQYNVVYINYTGGGNDNNSGRTKDQPVATWKKAYSLLTPGVDWDKNIIVITNTSGSMNLLITEADTDGKQATITGEWPWEGDKQVTGGVVLCSGGTTYSRTGARIGGPTKFKNVTFWGNETNKSACRLSCHLHDVWFDTGVVMKNFGDLDKSSGALAGHKSPHFHLQLYGDQLSSSTFPQATDKVMNVTIRSGQFGRILSSRIAGTKDISTYIIGRHDNPFKANITIDIEDVANNKKAGGVNYTDDIGYIAAGLTQGMMWGDITINVTRGSIATLVAGSQGNGLKMGSLNVPVSTFCGRTVVNLLAENDADVVIDNYFGACQGRVYGADGVCDAYFYGSSTLNMQGGTIKSNIFASSAGISGLRSADPDYFAKGWYTPDQRIPYAGSYAYGIDYLPYDRNKSIVTMTTHDGTIDLSETKITVNISGGLVEGNVYGASYGNSETLDGVYAPAHAGRLFGNTEVNISGGTIEGSVYGGGLGSTVYYDNPNYDSTGKATAAQKKRTPAEFKDVAQVYGNTNVTITGGAIGGNIYAGGGGVLARGAVGQETEFLEIAKVFGSTNLTINNPHWTMDAPFRGNIYGGGALADVEGATSVHIENGVILGNIYAGGEGEDGHPDKARVEGRTFVDLGDVISRDIEDMDVEVFGNVYGGGKLAQVVTPTDKLSDYLIRDSDLGTLFNKVHTYTTHVRLGENSHIYGQVFGGGEGKIGNEAAGLVVGQTDVVLDGAVTWAEIYGGGRMADVQGNTLVHFKKGRAGHNAFGGGLGVLGKRDNGDNLVALDPATDNLPDNRYEPLASADIQAIPDFDAVPTGNTFVVFDGSEDSFTHYEFKKARTINRDGDGKPTLVDGLYYTETNQYNPEHATHLFSIDHNIYGGGQTAADVAGNTYVHIRYGMVNQEMLNFGEDAWSTIYNSIANPQFCVFGGGYGYHSDVMQNTNVTMDIFGSGTYRYINEFTQWFATTGKDTYGWDTNTGDPEALYQAADHSTWSHGAPGRSAMDIIGGGYNGRVHGSTNITVGGDVILRKVYGGGYYSSVGNTNVHLKSGIFNRVYGGGLIGNVYGKANLTLGQQGGEEVHDANLHLLVKDAVYGGNDVSGTVGTSAPTQVTAANGVTYNTYTPVDDDNHGVRLNIYGGLVLGDVYGAGNGNHPGYGNPNYMQFDQSQHPSENYRKVIVEGQTEITNDSYALVYKYRPRTGRVVMNLQGNDGVNFNDNPQVDKVRIWGRTFGGGNSCNVGIWDGQEDDNIEKYADDATSWHPGDNFQGGGSIRLNIGDHVQLGNRNDSHERPNGLFMGSNGEHMITQSLDTMEARYYHQYYDVKARKYYPGFVVYENDAVTPIKRSTGLKAFTAFINNILTKTDSVKLNVMNLDGETEVQDVWMSNFVGGGYRGSMQANSHTGQFHYELPEGVTVGHSVVGGAFNAHIIYRVYATNYGDGTYRTDANGNYIYETIEPQQGVLSKAQADSTDIANSNPLGTTEYDYIKKLYAEGHEGDEAYKTGYLRYNFDGGIMAMDSKQNATSTGSRCHQIYNPNSLDPGHAGHADFTCDDGFIHNQNKALLYLKLQNRLHPIVNEATATTPLNVHGGIVYGGCFLTGYVDGDTWLEYDCSLSPLCTDHRFFGKENNALYGEVADMVRNNALNVFGAGYGEDTHTMGDAYLRINSIGHEDGTENSDYPFIYNVFGGGNMGTVAGSTNVYYNGGKQGTMLGSLYGGGYKGYIGGNTYVELVQGYLVNVYGGSRQADIGGAAHVWAYDGSTRPEAIGLAGHPEDYTHLIICNLYGGNDISGTIQGKMPAIWTEKVWTELEGKTFNSYVQVSGTEPGEHGFPLVGSIYGGGNGEQWSAELGDAPDVKRALLEIDGGTTLRAFGGGNMATVTDSAYIFVNAATNHYANVTFTEYQKGILNRTFFPGTYGGYRWLDGTRLVMDTCHVGRLFGGNNQADMDIQPMWNLKQGNINFVYSGGNQGRMTHDSGIVISIDSADIKIGNLFGGCRMADVTGSATVNVNAGHVGNVFGGNDVAGEIIGGVHVNVTGGVSGDIYGAGNGDYLYRYRYHKDSIGQVVERIDQNIAGVPYNQFFDVYGGVKNVSAADKLHFINDSVRPNVAQSSIYIAGTEQNTTYITGNVFCGGNAATIRKVADDANSYMHFNVGSYTVLNNVFLGSNGEGLTDIDKATKFSALNGFSFNTNAILHDYMEAVDIDGLPDGFAISDTLTNTYIGTFCVGGNRGSMTTTEPIRLTFPSSITIYNKIIGGCNEAYFSYGGYSFTGGMTGWNTDKSQPKIKLDIYSKFVPKKLQQQNGTYTLVDPINNSTQLLTDKYCNVYGGCYTRGYVYGDVEINMYSDMIGNFETQHPGVLANNIAYNETHGRPVFSVFGAGYGANTVVYGNTHIRLLNQNNTITNGDTPLPSAQRLGERVPRSGGIGVLHPSVNAIYGGGEAGKMVGTATIHVADGTVHSNVVGGALAGTIYGNTEILVGYPSYYEVLKTGVYNLRRSNFTAEELALLDGNGDQAVRQSIYLTRGDRINEAVYQAIKDWDVNQVAETNIVHVDNKVQKNWDDISINIMGGIYGGGYSRENVEDGQVALKNTVTKFTSTYNLATSHPEYWTAAASLSNIAIPASGTGQYKYGGNSSIWVQDEINAGNWEQSKHSHITISTETDAEQHLGKGGIYGDGHSSLVAAFRSAAVDGYGYADAAANNPKLLNTFQRMDILQIRDCSMKMYGDIDVATGQNDHTLYAVSRIGELMMNSRIDANSSALAATSELNSRNVIDFYNPVHFLGSITSNVGFDVDMYHKADGSVATDTYYHYKDTVVANNFDYSTMNIATDKQTYFAARNDGTAKNLIRINDPEGRGVHLKVVQENNYETMQDGSRTERSFYGPLSGVVEFELMHASARGGGYVYTNNLHDEKISKSPAVNKGSHTAADDDTRSFMQTSGNVVFKPILLTGGDERKVFDDCYPTPYGQINPKTQSILDVAHYWFVEANDATWCSYAKEPENASVDQVNKTITVNTEEELAWVYEYVDQEKDSPYTKGFKGWTIRLGRDMDLNQLTIIDRREVPMIWCPIGDKKNTAFKGTFDGSGYKISGLTVDIDLIQGSTNYGNKQYATNYDKQYGMFAKTDSATIHDVELEDLSILQYTGTENYQALIGSLVAQSKGTTRILDCSVHQFDTIRSTAANSVSLISGFVGEARDSTAILRNWTSGAISDENVKTPVAPASGMVGTLRDNARVEWNYSVMNLQGTAAAGLVDTLMGNAKLAHSYFAGTVSHTGENAWGAVAAQVVGDNAGIKHCYYDNTKNPSIKGVGDADNVYAAGGWSAWSTEGLPTSKMVADQLWHSCYNHDGHNHDQETLAQNRCEQDVHDSENPLESAWNKGVWTFEPGFYPRLQASQFDCHALTSSFVMTMPSNITDWMDVKNNFELPRYVLGEKSMLWSSATNTVLLDNAATNNTTLVTDAHLYLGGPDELVLRCDEYEAVHQPIYVSRIDINSPADTAWYNHLTNAQKMAYQNQLFVDTFTTAMLSHKEVTMLSKTKTGDLYNAHGYDGDLHIWNREHRGGEVTNTRSYHVNGTITVYTGYDNPYIWNELSIPFDVANTMVHRTRTDNEYNIWARHAELTDAQAGGHFWLRALTDDIQYGGSVFQQGWLDPETIDPTTYGHRPAIIRFPQTMIVEEVEYLAGDYWCYNPSNVIDENQYNNGGSEIRITGSARYSATPAQNSVIRGTDDVVYDDVLNHYPNADMTGSLGGYAFRVYGNPTLSSIQLEGYYWILESERRDTTGVSDNLVKPVFGTNVAQWFSLQQDPVIPPFGIWMDGSDEFKQQALDEGGSAPLRISPLHEKAVNEQYGEKEASFTASGHNGLLGVFSYEDQEIFVYDPTGRLVFQAFVRANTGFTIQLTHSLFIIRGANSPQQVKVMI